MNEHHIIDEMSATALTEGALRLVVGGDGDPNDPVGNVTGDVDMDTKATPVLF